MYMCIHVCMRVCVSMYTSQYMFLNVYIILWKSVDWCRVRERGGLKVGMYIYICVHIYLFTGQQSNIKEIYLKMHICIILWKSYIYVKYTYVNWCRERETVLSYVCVFSYIMYIYLPRK